MIERPILLCGPGKSGTTLLLDLMSLHPDVTWFSGWTARFPRTPQLAALSRLNDVALLERRTRNVRRWPRPAEAYGIWDHYFPGLSQADADWGEERASREGADALRRVIAVHLRAHGKQRFLTKYTGWPRFAFMRALLPDCELAYIDRDPRAVVHSYERYKWWFKDRPDALAALSPRERIDFYTSKYLAYFHAKQRAASSQPFVQVKYETLIASPETALEQLCARVRLAFPPKFRAAIRSFDVFQGSNNAWKKKLSPEDGRYLTEKLEEPIRALGYEA